MDDVLLQEEEVVTVEPEQKEIPPVPDYFAKYGMLAALAWEYAHTHWVEIDWSGWSRYYRDREGNQWETDWSTMDWAAWTIYKRFRRGETIGDIENEGNAQEAPGASSSSGATSSTEAPGASSSSGAMSSVVAAANNLSSGFLEHPRPKAVSERRPKKTKTGLDDMSPLLETITEIGNDPKDIGKWHSQLPDDD